MIRHISILLLLAAALLSTGCTKKKSAESAAPETSAMPQVSAQKDSADIFDEFYNDNTAGAKAPAAKTATAPAETSAKPAPAAKMPRPAAPVGSPSDLDPNGRYVVQVSCVLSQSLAQSIVAKLKAKGLPAYISVVENPTPELIGTYYRVRVGGFAGISAAKEFGQKYLAGDGYEYWVATKDDGGTGGMGLGGTSVTPAAPARAPDNGGW